MASSRNSASAGGARRRLILSRSVIVGALGVIPVPQVEETLRASVRRGLLRNLAQQRHVDIDDDALNALVSESDGQQRLDTLLAIGNLLTQWRNRRRGGVLLGALSLRRLDQVVRTYDQAALFDHYCAHHHLGPGIDQPQARRLRQDFESAASETHRTLAGDAVRAIASSAWGAVRAVASTVREHRLGAAPVLLASMVNGARERALSLRSDGLLAPLRHGLDRYAGRLASSYDLRTGHAARHQEGDEDER